MKKLLFMILLVSATPLFAQRTASNPLGGNLAVQDAGTCSTAGSFLWQVLPSNASTTTINLSGTFSGTVTVRESNNGGGSWTTAGTQTTVGTSSYATNGFTDICADVTTYTSGTIGVTISTGLNTGPQGPAGPAGNGGGITSVAVLPVTCTPGVTVNVILSVPPFGEYECKRLNTFTKMDKMGSISPYDYGAKGGWKYSYNCTFVNTSATINCTGGSTDVTFQCPGGTYPCTTATPGCSVPSPTCDAGKIEFGDSLACNGVGLNCIAAGSGVTVVPQGTITTVNSATQIVVSLAATASCTPGVTPVCPFAYGPVDDTTALNNAANAAWNGGMNCYDLHLPTDTFAFSAALFITATGNACGEGSTGGWGGDLNSIGPVLSGDGPSASVLIPLPSFNFATCTGNLNACIFGVGNGHAHDFSVNGLGQNLQGTTHNNSLFVLFGSNGAACSGGFAGWNLSFSGWGLQSSSLIGFNYGQGGCNDPSVWNVNVEMFGSQPCSINLTNNAVSAYTLLCFGSTGPVITFQGGNIFNSYSSEFAGNLASNGNTVVMGSNTTWNSKGDIIATEFGAGINNSTLVANGGSNNTINLDGDFVQLVNQNSAAQMFFLNSAPTNLHLRNTTLSSQSGVNNHLFTTSAAGNNIYDDGGNTFVQGGAANSITAGTWFGSGSVTGVAQTAANITPTSGFGTGCATAGQCISAITGASQLEQFTVTYGTGPTSPQVITIVFPTPFQVVPICSMSDVGGTNAFPTSIVTTTCTATGASFTITNTPVATSTDILQVRAVVP
jgi:hypothetical protein